VARKVAEWDEYVRQALDAVNIAISDAWADRAAEQALRAYAFDPDTLVLHPLNALNNINYKVEGVANNRVQRFVLRIHRSPDVTASALQSELEW
jgi:hypothetical protein